MALTPGTRIGSYEVIVQIGAGGMGEVYRARDTKLNRDVALKILPDAFTLDGDRIARFRREAQVLASLNHPNIATIHGFEDSGHTHALVLELVEGPTLADRIGGSPIPLDEALPIARQIAEALEAAHEQGIVHRDLKPANIKLRDDGTVKVLDFGLAKLADPVGNGAAALSQSPTITTPAQMTGIGTLLGTAAYMSPEQAKGRPADKRCDIWAFGCVLYEMLTGRRAFEGDDVSDTLAAVLRGEPDWGKLPASVPPSIQTLARACLRKDRKERISDASTARFLLNEVSTAAAASSEKPKPPLWKRLAPALATLVAATLVTSAIWWTARPSQIAAPVVRFPIILAQGERFSNLALPSVAISADGSQVVYVAKDRLYLRSMSDEAARPIPGSEVADPVMGSPAFSPDGRSVAFWSGNPGTDPSFPTGSLKRIALTGGAVVTICQAALPLGLSWDSDGIVFGQPNKGVMHVPANGGTPELLVGIKSSEFARDPQMLPGGALLFTLAPIPFSDMDKLTTDVWDKAQVVIQSLKSGERTTVIQGGSAARYVPTGHLVYAIGGSLFAVPVDIGQRAVTGTPTPIVEHVLRATYGNVLLGSSHFSVSNSGSLVYIPGQASMSLAQRDVALFDRNGGADPLRLPPAAYEYPRASPDGRQIAVGTDDAKEANVWVYDLAGKNALRRLTFGGRNRYPIWSADGRYVVFQSDREGDQGVFWQRADGTGPAERLTMAEQGTQHIPESWSPRDDVLLFSAVKGGATTASWTLSIRDKKTKPYKSASVFTRYAAFSPDGRWIAYNSGEGRFALFVEPFPSTGAKFELSSTFVYPVWSRDGRELFYTPPGQLAVVSVTTRPTFTFSSPTILPRGFNVVVPTPTSARSYDILPDGRFLGTIDAGQTASGTLAPQQIQVVLNWFNELKQRVPIK